MQQKVIGYKKCSARNQEKYASPYKRNFIVEKPAYSKYGQNNEAEIQVTKMIKPASFPYIENAEQEYPAINDQYAYVRVKPRQQQACCKNEEAIPGGFFQFTIFLFIMI